MLPGDLSAEYAELGCCEEALGCSEMRLACRRRWVCLGSAGWGCSHWARLTVPWTLIYFGITHLICWREGASSLSRCPASPGEGVLRGGTAWASASQMLSVSCGSRWVRQGHAHLELLFIKRSVLGDDPVSVPPAPGDICDAAGLQRSLMSPRLMIWC